MTSVLQSLHINFIWVILFVASSQACIAQSAEELDCLEDADYTGVGSSSAKRVDISSSKLYHCLVRYKEVQENKEKYLGEIAYQISLMGGQAENQPELIQDLIETVKQSDRRYKESYIKYLYLALGATGRKIPEPVILHFIDNNRVHQQILEEVLQAMYASDTVPERTLPRLLQLMDHPMQTSVTYSTGSTETTRRYPVRINACKCLRDLGIECAIEKKKVNEEQVEEEIVGLSETARWTRKEFRVFTDVKTPSLLKIVESWLISEDEEKWKAALEVVKTRNTQDIKKLFQKLKQDQALSKRKRQYYESLH